jgi:NAD(P)-dependent dehydrogenase (short-subunit alcohol dehydrogenase family)
LIAPQRILITGAGAGIGRAAAQQFLAQGWEVALMGRREAALRETAGDAPALFLAGDVGNLSDVTAAFDTIKTQWGRLDVLFNNAGTNAPAIPLEELSFDQWQTVLGANLTAAFLCTQEAFRIMKDQSPRGGRIINNGSVSSQTPRPNSAPYTATKHAITGLTKSTSLDGRKYDIACGQIDIGNASTNMTQKMSTGVLQPNLELAIEPTMDVRNVANAVVFMASLALDANVSTITVMATKMPLAGRG